MVEVRVFTCTSTTIRTIPTKCATFDENHAFADPVGCFRNWLIVEISILSVVACARKRSWEPGAAAWAPGVIDPVWEPLIGLQSLCDVGIAEASNFIRWTVPDLLILGVRKDLNRHQGAVEVPTVCTATEGLTAINSGHVVTGPPACAVIPALIAWDIGVDLSVALRVIRPHREQLIVVGGVHFHAQSDLFQVG